MRNNELSEVQADDWSTIGRFQNGDSSAFDELMGRHQQRAYKFACQLTKDRDEAADVVACAFGRVLRSLDKFRGDSSFTSWLYRIELNCFLDIRKKARSRQTFSLDNQQSGHDGPVEFQITGFQESAYEHMERRERVAAIEKAMKRLPPNQRQVFVMFQADALSYEDIAQMLAVPIGTVKSRLNRARLHIRNSIRMQRTWISG
jgi:RNA polymerase sigma-70 factor (ECF subfamily)